MVWARSGIDRKLRSIDNLAMLTALNCPNQMRNHIEGALNNGCTVDEIREIFLQSAVYCGLPAARDAPQTRVCADLKRHTGVGDVQRPQRRRGHAVQSPQCGQAKPLRRPEEARGPRGFHELAKTADVVIQNFAPDAFDRLVGRY